MSESKTRGANELKPLCEQKKNQDKCRRKSGSEEPVAIFHSINSSSSISSKGFGGRGPPKISVRFGTEFRKAAAKASSEMKLNLDTAGEQLARMALPAFPRMTLQQLSLFVFVFAAAYVYAQKILNRLQRLLQHALY